MPTLEISNLFSHHGEVTMKNSEDHCTATITIGEKSFSIKINPINGFELAAKKMYDMLQNNTTNGRVQYIFFGPGNVKMKLISF